MTRARIVGGSRYIVQTLVVWLFLALTCSFAAALDNNRTIAQFAHTAWGPKDGAPSVVQALAQTADGFLWLGTPDGLYRFDGVTFERVEPPSWSVYPALRVSTLFAAPNGDLWIGFAFGVVSVIRNGTTTSYTADDGLPAGAILAFALDREGTLWASTTAGLARLEGNRWKQVGKEWNFPGKLAYGMFVDHLGTLWVASEDRIFFLPAGTRRFQTTAAHVGEVPQIAEAPNGKLWMTETTRSVRPVPLKTKQGPPDDTEVRVGSAAMLFDRDGAMWITSLGDGIRRAPAPAILRGKIGEFGNAVESFTSKDGLSDDSINAILQDREGNIWVGTHKGLDRFRKTNLIPVPLPFSTPQPVLVAGDNGDAWIYSTGHMIRIHERHAYEIKAFYRFRDLVGSCYRDPEGTIWWVGMYGIYRLKNGVFSRLPLPKELPTPYSNLVFVTQDRSHKLWAAAGSDGLFRWQNEKWERFDAGPGAAKSRSTAAFTDWMGRLWFGYEAGEIVLVKGATVEKEFFPRQSPVGGIRAIDGANGHVWVGGDLGLASFRGSTFHLISTADASQFRTVFSIVETSGGDLWLCESRGVIHIRSPEVQKVLEDPNYRVQYELFDSFDGLPGTFGDAGKWSKAIQTVDGQIWFAASNGVAKIDPAKIFKNVLLPPVSILSVLAGSKTYEPALRLDLPARTTNVQIDYTALSLSVPERVRFRYMLEGLDTAWHDAGTRRQAFFTNLYPKQYSFRVIACNDNGVWNDAGATIDFTIAPAWFQTIWFLAVCIAIGVLLLFAIYRVRVRQVANAIAARFDERLDERTRIARDFHDTLLQTIQGSKLVADSALKRADDPLRMREALEQLSIWLARATTEGRTALNSLRTSTTETNDLAEAFRRVLAECQTESALEISFSVVGDTKDMHPIVRDEVYRIGYEAIRNACLHSQASKLQVTLSYSDELSVAVADNGVGMDPWIAERGKDGHFGLRGMRERAARIAGKLTVTSSPKSGTQVKLIVPGKIIYRKTTSEDH